MYIRKIGLDTAESKPLKALGVLNIQSRNFNLSRFYAAGDFRELRRILSDWKFPTTMAYPEYHCILSQAAGLEKDLARTEKSLNKCCAANDFRELRVMLGSWPFPKTYPEYPHFSDQVPVLEQDFNRCINTIEKYLAARDFRMLFTLLDAWRFPMTYPEYESFADKTAEVEEDFDCVIPLMEKRCDARDFRGLRGLLLVFLTRFRDIF